MDRYNLDCEIKAVGVDSARVLKFLGSNATRDRVGDEIDAKGWDLKNYKRNPVFLWAHQRDILPIGRAIDVRVENGALMFDVEFAPAEINPFADAVYQHYKAGFLKGVSVGFQAHKSEAIDATSEAEIDARKKKPDLWPGRKFAKQELLELSAVPVGANPDALLSSKSIDAAPSLEAVQAWCRWMDQKTTTLEAPPDQATQRDTVGDEAGAADHGDEPATADAVAEAALDCDDDVIEIEIE